MSYTSISDSAPRRALRALRTLRPLCSSIRLLTGLRARLSRKGAVYLAAPRQRYWTPEYNAALATLREHYPHRRIISCRDAWKSMEHWRRTYPDRLKRVSVFVILTDGGFVGRGVLTEWRYARPRVTACLAFTSGGELVPVSGLVVRNRQDWQRYAAVLDLAGVEVE